VWRQDRPTAVATKLTAERVTWPSPLGIYHTLATSKGSALSVNSRYCANLLGLDCAVRLLVAFVLLFPLFVLLSVFIKSRTSQYWRMAKQPQIERERQSIVTWARLPFTKVDRTDNIVPYLRSLRVFGEEQLNGAQESALYAAIARLISAFTSGGPEAYFRFRLPSGANYRFSERQLGMILTEWDKINDPAKAPADDLELFKWWLTKQSGTNYYKGFWKGVCFDSSEVYKALGTNNLDGRAMTAGIYVTNAADWRAFSDFVFSSTFNAGISTYNSSFFFDHSPRGRFVHDCKFLCCSMYFFVLPSPPDPIFPVAVHYVWDESSTNWLPTDFIVGNLLRRSQIDFVF
jgi:hypothetical protein